MYNRSNTPDSIGIKLKELALVVVRNNNVLKKSKDSGEWWNYTNDMITARKGVEVIGSELYQIFLDALNDFKAGKINKARYSDHLTEYKNFFAINNLEKADLPVSMRADVILKEIGEIV